MQAIKGKFSNHLSFCIFKTIYMKLLFYVTLCFMTGFSACKGEPSSKSGNKQEEESKIKPDVKGLSTVDSVSLKKESLKNMTGLTIEQLNALLPPSFNGARQMNYASNSTMGYTYVEAQYALPKKANLRIILNDCAGRDGANLYEDSYLQRLKADSINEDEYTKPESVFGTKAVAYYNKKTGQSTLTYPVGGRVLAVLQGNHMKPEDLISVAEQLHLQLP